MPVTAYVSLKKATQICMGFLFEIKLGLLKKKKRPEQHFYEVLDGNPVPGKKERKGAKELLQSVTPLLCPAKPPLAVQCLSAVQGPLVPQDNGGCEGLCSAFMPMCTSSVWSLMSWTYQTLSLVQPWTPPWHSIAVLSL
jgi:hypothetical protein